MSPRWRRSPLATERTVGSSLFLAHARRGSLFRVNETIAALWRLLAEPVSEEEALHVFRQAFPHAAPERLAEDVAIMFADLRDEDLIEEADPGPGSPAS